MFHTRNSDFVQAEPDSAWLPKHCVVECYAYITAPLYTSSKPLYETDIQVENIERRSFDQDDFRLWYGTPGVRVQDYTDPKATVLDPHQYLVPSSADALGKRPSRGTLIILINALMAGIILCIIYLRYRRKD